MFCNQCGAQLEEGLVFCTNCGAKVGGAQPEPIQDQDQTVVIDSFVQPEQPVNEAPKQDWNSAPSNNWNETPNNWQNTQPENNWNNKPDNIQSKLPSNEWNSGSQNGTVPSNNWNNASGNNNNQQTSAGSVDFGEAVKLFFANYANFTGRSSRSEYWWAWLFNTLVSAAVSAIPGVGAVVALALLVPGLAVGVRRLHDTGKSWLFMLWSFVPLFGTILLLIQYCKESDGDNQWGPAPRN